MDLVRSTGKLLKEFPELSDTDQFNQYIVNGGKDGDNHIELEEVNYYTRKGNEWNIFIDITDSDIKERVFEKFPDLAYKVDEIEGKLYITKVNIINISEVISKFLFRKKEPVKLDTQLERVKHLNTVSVSKDHVTLVKFKEKADLRVFYNLITNSNYNDLIKKRLHKSFFKAQLLIMEPNNQYPEYNQYRPCNIVTSNFNEILPYHDFYYDITGEPELIDIFQDYVETFSFIKDVDKGIAGYVNDNPSKEHLKKL